MIKRAFIFILLLALFSAPGGAFSEICLRVVARDNTREAQEEKIRVRNRVLGLVPQDEKKLIAAWPLLQKAVQAEADCALSLRFYTPPTQKTPRLTVYITIGPGEGKNWFGVLFDEALLLCGEKTESELTVFYFPLISFLLSLFSGAPGGTGGW